MKRASFFKVMIGDFEEKLKIPLAFVKNFKGKLLVELILKNPVGHVWHVEVKSIDGCLFFQNGWKAFVEENSLQTGDFLVFAYDGYSELEVIIFGSSGCDKLGALVDKRKSILLEENEDQQEGTEIYVKGAGPCSCKYIQKVGTEKPSLPGKTSCGNVPSKQRPSTELKTKMVFEAEFCPFYLKYPHFTATLSQYHMRIPKVFMRELCAKTEVLTLWGRNEKKPCRVRIQVCNRKDGRGIFGAGWRDFIIMHNLRLGDKGIFEFIKPNVARVHVIPAKK